MMDHENSAKRNKLGVVSGVYIPVCLNILSILMFLRFGLILGQVGLLGMLGKPPDTYLCNFDRHAYNTKVLCSLHTQSTL